ncbi:MAG: hypothetical protein HUN04_08390 [Desulfobacter sp.]|nr:MAG: hypothetical protein HUN04_08390 [Desulfobacter sp.]
MRKNMAIPPIALFTYNRPDKTQTMLNTLKTMGAKSIYIFCDGPRDNDLDREMVCRNLALVEDYPFDNKIIFRAGNNQGLSNSLIRGISQAFEHEDELIILEDDCLPFGGMLEFMAENLAHWKNQKTVFSVSAYQFIRPLGCLAIPYDVFLSHRFLPWGWATWKDRWHAVLPELENRVNPYGSFDRVPDHAGRDLLYHTYAVEKKMVDSWAIPLGLITLKHGYRHVMPTRPLVNNTGMDDTGTNTGSAHNRIIPVKQPPEYRFPLKMCPPDYRDESIDALFLESMDVLLPPLWLEKQIHEEIGRINSDGGLV